MKKLLQFVGIMACLAGGYTSSAQQRPMFSQYLQNGYLINPAVAGIEDYTDVRTGYRNQWSGLDGAPVSFYASGHAPLRVKPLSPEITMPVRGRSAERSLDLQRKYYDRSRNNSLRHGVGAIIQRDNVGATSMTSFAVSYAFHLPLSNSVRLSSGVTVGAMQFRLDPSKLLLLNPNDNAIKNNVTADWVPNIDWGLMLYSERFFVNFTTSQVLESRLQVADVQAIQTGGLRLHSYLNAGYRIRMGEEMSVLPSVLVRMVPGVPATLDANIRGSYKELLWAGFSYRHQNAVVMMAGLQATKMIGLGYSYDLATGPLRNAFGATHEVVLNVRLGAAREQGARYFW